MNTSLRRELESILEDRRVVWEDHAPSEQALVEVVTALATKTVAYRKDLAKLLDKADDLKGKLPGFEVGLESMVGAVEMSDKMLEDLLDATLGEVQPYFKKLGLPMPRG